jgi:hypothetical protein
MIDSSPATQSPPNGLSVNTHMRRDVWSVFAKISVQYRTDANSSHGVAWVGGEFVDWAFRAPRSGLSIQSPHHSERVRSKVL